MRVTKTADDFSLRAYSGTSGVLLAMNLSEARRKGLLGFALKRKEQDGAWETMCGMLHFPKFAAEAGKLIPTDQAPIQKFRWSDYRVHADLDYTYRVQPVYGTWDHLELADPIELKVHTASLASGKHRVLFNRAAAASQAFSRKFPDLAKKLKPGMQMPKEALDWLSRGVREQILQVVEAAKDGSWALDICIYEYELQDIIDAVNAANKRGVNVRVVYHAKPGDEQTTVNEQNLAKLPKKCKRARITTSICHDKFVVLSKLADGKRQPQEVLCGSTNFTENGVYRQANVVHVVHDPAVAKIYEEQFEFLFAGNDQAATRKHDTEHDPMPELGQELFVGFSPRTGKGDLAFFIKAIESAQRDVLFSTAFDLDKTVYDALQGAPHDDILRFGIQNKRSTITGTHADRTAEFEAAAMLNFGLEGWLKESTAGQKGNILIHTKVVVVDFTSDSPMVISGSHNLSKNASQGNDENYLVICKHPDVADCYGIEVMRIYDHYRFRFVQAQTKGAKPPSLTPSDAWAARYYKEGSLPCLDRERFGAAVAKRARA
jgi:phosphatidylserine/phosphatidylglycerophosphate/cardiolipin synthase-like enzyme